MDRLLSNCLHSETEEEENYIISHSISGYFLEFNGSADMTRCTYYTTYCLNFRFKISSIRRAEEHASASNNKENFALLSEDISSLDSAGSKYLNEPSLTVAKRSELIYNSSSRPHNISGIIRLQRQVSRSLYCNFGNRIVQGTCEQKCNACLLSHNQVDCAHYKLIKKPLGSVAVNVAIALRL